MAPRTQYLKSSRKFDVPLFCAAWLPKNAPAGAFQKKTEEDSESKALVKTDSLVVFGGGGGAGKHGVKNGIIIASYDSKTQELSESLYHLSTGDDPPFQLSVHPNGEAVAAAFSKSCQVFDLTLSDEDKLTPFEKQLPLPDASEKDKFVEQTLLKFSPDGSRLAAGGDDGDLRVFEWPSLEVSLHVEKAHEKAFKDADFSHDGNLLASTSDSGPLRVFDLAKQAAVASLSVPNGARLGLCRFSHDEERPFLFATAVKDGRGYFVVWSRPAWKMLGVKKIHEEPISCLAISPSNKLLATGTPSGDIAIVEIKSMTARQRVRGAHMVFVTSLAFSPNSSALLSVSGDSSARVTPVAVKDTEFKEWHAWLVLLVLFILTGLFAVYMYHYGEKFWKFPLGRLQPARPDYRA